jgi:hypothetical protein
LVSAISLAFPVTSYSTFAWGSIGCVLSVDPSKESLLVNQDPTAKFNHYFVESILVPAEKKPTQPARREGGMFLAQLLNST